MDFYTITLQYSSPVSLLILQMGLLSTKKLSKLSHMVAQLILTRIQFISSKFYIVFTYKLYN